MRKWLSGNGSKRLRNCGDLYQNHKVNLYLGHPLGPPGAGQALIPGLPAFCPAICPDDPTPAWLFSLYLQTPVPLAHKLAMKKTAGS